LTQEANQASDPNMEKGLVVAESETVLPAITPDSSLDLTYGEIGQKVLSNEARVNLKAALVARLTIIQRLPYEGILDGPNLLTSGTGESVVVVQDRTGGMAITLTRLASLNNLLLPSDPKLLGITQREAISRYHEFLNVLFEQRLSGTMGSLPFIQSLDNIKAYFSAISEGYSGKDLIISFYTSLGLEARKYFKGALIGSQLLALIDTDEVLIHPIRYSNKLIAAAKNIITSHRHEAKDGYEIFLDDDETSDLEDSKKTEALETALNEFASIWEEIDDAFVAISTEGQKAFFRIMMNDTSVKDALKVSKATRILDEISDDDYSFESPKIFARVLRASISLSNERRKRRLAKEEKKKRKEECERRKIEEEAEKSLENPINPEAID